MSSTPRETGWLSVVRRSTSVSLFTMLGVVAGFVVDILLVARLGVGSQTDAFFGAYTLPLLLITSLAAMQPALITVLAGEHQETSAFGALLIVAGLAGLVAAGAGVLLARPIVALITPGFGPEVAGLAAILSSILFLRVPASAISEVCRAELFVRRQFALASFSTAIPSLVAATLLILAGNKIDIQTFAWSLAAGGLAQALLLFALAFGPLLRSLRHGVRQAGPVLRQAAGLILAPLAGLLLRQGVTLAERILGSLLPAGSVTALSYASRLTMIVAGVLFDPFTSTSLPSLAALWAGEPGSTARAELRTLFRILIYTAIPVGLATAALSTPAIRIFFERGQVTPQSALLMGSVLGIYALSLPFLGPYRGIQTFFYAIKEPGPVVILHGSLAAVAIALDLILVRVLGAAGLALAYVLSCGLVTTAGLLWLARRSGDLGWRSLADSLLRLATVSAAMALTLFGISHWLGTGEPGASRGHILLASGLAGLAGLTVFVALGTILRLEAITAVWHRARARWRVGT